MSSNGRNATAGILHRPRRNRYFYGKKLDVHHFELEQDYFNAKRWLLNRLISGFGVICGLKVIQHDDDTVIVKPGLAIDKWGREVIVTADTAPTKIAPPAPGAPPPGGENFIYVCLEYLECETDPAPVLQNECHGGQRCMPDTVHERYKVSTHDGKAPKLMHRCQIPDLTDDDTGEIDYDIMAKWITEKCPAPADEPCIPLAQIEFDEDGTCKEIDLTVRPLVYTNDLLFEMILSMTEPEQPGKPRGGKH